MWDVVYQLHSIIRDCSIMVDDGVVNIGYALT